MVRWQGMEQGMIGQCIGKFFVWTKFFKMCLYFSFLSRWLPCLFQIFPWECNKDLCVAKLSRLSFRKSPPQIRVSSKNKLHVLAHISMWSGGQISLISCCNILQILRQTGRLPVWFILQIDFEKTHLSMCDCSNLWMRPTRGPRHLPGTVVL